MYSYIIGEFVEMTPEGIVIENNGIGYDIKTSSLTAENIPKSGEFVKVYTYLHVREDDMSLYGFLTRDELNVFKLLINVNGIGPKGALGILSAISTDDLRFAVLADDVAAIKALPGIGPKTAQKIIIELKDKLKLDEVFESALSKNKKADNNSNVMMIRNDAVEALVSLGYSSKDAIKAVKKVDDIDKKNSEAILKEALKSLATL